MTICAQRSMLCWLAFGAAVLGVLTGRWWLLLAGAGIWWWSRSRMRRPTRLTLLPGGVSTTGLTAEADWNPAGLIPGDPQPDYHPTVSAGSTSGGATGNGRTCASYV